MALCLAESLIECNGFDLKNQMQKYSMWLNDGYLSCADKSIGSGKATRAAIDDFDQTGNLLHGNAETLGNGSLMRLAPIPMFFLDQDIKTVAEYCVKSSSITHNNAECATQCAKLGIVLYYLLKENVCKVHQLGRLVMDPKFDMDEDGRAVTTLHNAFWSILNNHDFEASIISAINLRGDSDTVGAVTGAIAGAMYGYSAIPDRWLEKIQKKSLISKKINGMWAHVAQQLNLPPNKI